MKTFNSIKEELRYITEKNNGFCSPNAVVEFAKNPKTLLHEKFIWDDSKAAEEYRLWQARRIISLELTIIPSEKQQESIIVREFQSLKEDRTADKGYRLITDIMNNPITRKQLIDQALQELIRIKTKYQNLIELSSVFKEIDKLQKKQADKRKDTQDRKSA